MVLVISDKDIIKDNDALGRVLKGFFRTVNKAAGTDSMTSSLVIFSRHPVSPFLEGGDKEKVDLPRFLESQTSETMAVRDSPDYKIIPYEKGIREHVVPEGTRVRSTLTARLRV